MQMLETFINIKLHNNKCVKTKKQIQAMDKKTNAIYIPILGCI